ncbi:hypothetical protein C1Y08_06925 [Pseudomonas sp. FW306-02-F02-AA]|uniref:Uncharacterized protein n=2 Tax=Pseudomonas TaxID=286 RepID=A0A423GR40_9PSED|nr:hypothetical protein AO353_00870 [Pseudomonas fluorescens]PMZ04783.1 hypothetical protein C1Y07_08550 [Pseudomonas sp. FW306-02-F02-AB]PMZ09444.1 hypothetical protein C1Y06_14730 [Pseudomonas sp. FW306-02-H06C]PMZ16691.1 hypothetical protein C1Y08_06925 [Pseudomonas sp. FW306-02-F02-AA]PMZ21097.1 hypothetical protein C1Y09_16050 [Pseudomonas sp. FW306-02-F08-AA]PMZ28052.1 hypothetical protein C1Y05_09940 [Pseudomonas sp. FW306-02-F04-BA]PMZ35168.1 hypothetical protein C1X99_08480 [Pseudomo
MDAELIEGNYVLYQGDLSTNCVGKAQGAGSSSGAFASNMAWTWKISENAGQSRPTNRAYHIQESSPA